MKPQLAILGIGMAAMTVFNFVVPDATLFREPSLARMIFWHLPCAFVSSGFLFFNAYLGIQYFRQRRLHWDVRLEAATVLATAFATLTMATGILFSKAQWDEWWNWDPRQSSFLMVLFLFALALALRGGFSDVKKRAAVSAGYAVLSFLPSVFLTFVFPRLKQVEQMSQHPSQTVIRGLLKGDYGVGVWGTLIMLSLLAIVLYSQRVRAGLIEIKLEEKNGLDTFDSGNTPAHGVVRPVAVPEEN